MVAMKFFSLIALLALLQDPMKEEPKKPQDEPKKEEPKQEPKKEEPKKEDPKQDPKKEEPKKVAPIVTKLNEVRKAFGVGPVEEDEKLSDACKKHADYLSRNNATGEKEDPHDENKKKSAYSVEGKKAGENSLIGFDGPDKAVDNWMGTFIMRCQLLDPGVKKIGWGNMSKICVLDVHSARTDVDFEPILAPHDKQDKIPVRFGYGGDDPDPLPKNVKPGDVGYPITVLFPKSAVVKNVIWSVKDAAGKRVDCHTSTPEGRMVRHDRIVDHAIALIPKGRMFENSNYHVSVKCSVNGKPFEKSWTFTTQ